jgi:hypothetical protein
MKNPPHPGRSIKDACLGPLNLSVTGAIKVQRPTGHLVAR